MDKNIPFIVVKKKNLLIMYFWIYTYTDNISWKMKPKLFTLFASRLRNTCFLLAFTFVLFDYIFFFLHVLLSKYALLRNNLLIVKHNQVKCVAGAEFWQIAYNFVNTTSFLIQGITNLISNTIDFFASFKTSYE